jgi:hypothetical protein
MSIDTDTGRISAARLKSARRIPSDGLTVDTVHGPADEVVAMRLLAGVPTPHTMSDVTLAYILAEGGSRTAALPLAAALRKDVKTVQRGIDRARSRYG